MTSDVDWYLDEFRASDAQALVEYLNEPEIYKNTLNIPFPYTKEQGEEWVKQKQEESLRNGQPVSFAIRSRDGKVIGGVGFDGLEPGNTHFAEIGYWIAKPFWNQGIASSAVKAACKIAFDDFGLVRIQAHVFATNAKSAAVLEKNGFALEGTLRKRFMKSGELKDAKLYALIRD